ncbi:hypothetical protein ATK17_2040 [Branchiibius hedensis]|uniref:Uncharacterized protein n=1 Tax=Branchiibius hedensis TaxID=672460 RepID=A0A2Y8ZS42_9MICO|nr:hypothetical protein [Branchiibius hedensis]PWJ25902.1 hypothetical protein ATK17_2040 [Branchiibius hedensis]SSA34715.1 hypothetical protein SAMN04489750_2040 [Branchiibius hedensis]
MTALFTATQQTAPLPQWALWIGFGIAITTAIIALATYVANSRERTRAQARLVYAEVKEQTTFGANVETDVFSSIIPQIEEGAIEEQHILEETSGQTVKRYRTATVCICVTIELHNDSDELLLEWRAMLFDRSLKRYCDNAPLVAQPTVKPHSSAQIAVIFKAPDPANSADLSVDVTFRDSVGRTWQRRQGSPVESPRKWSIRLLGPFPATPVKQWQAGQKC